MTLPQQTLGPPYTAEQMDKLFLLRLCDDYGWERVDLWLRSIKASTQLLPKSLAPGTANDPRR